MNIRALLANTTTRGRLVIAGSAVGILVVAFLLMRLAAAPSMAPLVTGVDPAQTGKVTAALDEAGIGYRLANNGTAVDVDKTSIAQARVALADAGVSGAGGPKGWEMFDKRKFGSSDFDNKVAYQRALEGEIARTVMEVQGVSNATVHVVLPQDQLFQDDAKPTTASVMLTAGGTAVDAGSVRGIAQLVSASVEGLKPANVTITDQSGALLWPSGEAGADGGPGGTSKIAAEQRYEQQLQAQLEGMLIGTLGPDKARVQVHADLNVDQATEEVLAYDKRGAVATRVETEKEELKNGKGAAGGASGTRGNVPTYGQSTAAGGGDYRRTTEKKELGVGKTITRRTIAPGKVEKLDVALVVDSSVPAASLQPLKDAVASAAGIDGARGDTIAMSQVAFSKEAKAGGAAAASALPSALGAVKYAGLGIALLVFLVLAGRHLKRREGQAVMAEPRWLREITTQMPLAELEATRVVEPHAPLPPRQVDPMRRQVEQIVEQEPERVASTLRGWMQEDR
jgi:flagellar M-ring protein FliF